MPLKDVGRQHGTYSCILMNLFALKLLAFITIWTYNLVRWAYALQCIVQVQCITSALMHMSVELLVHAPNQ